MYEGHAVGVVVPAYNEQRHVGPVIETMPAFVDRVYPVDDCSTDWTRRVLRAHAARDRSAEEPAVTVLTHEENRGVGASVCTGYRQAVADDLDVVAVVNGDGQMDPSILHRILDPVVTGRADYAKGNRLASPHTRREMSRWRTFGNALLTGLTRVASGYWGMTDPQNGYTAIAASTVESLPLERLYSRYGFLNDLLVRLNVRDVTVADVPHRAIYRDEDSGISYRTFVPGLSALLAVRFADRLVTKHVRRRLHPLAVCYALGGVGLLATVLTALVATLNGLLGVAASGLLAGGAALDARRHAELCVSEPDPAADAEVGPESGELAGD